MERIKSICGSLIVSFTLTVICIVFFSMLLVKTNISENMINGVIIVISSISILIGASVSTIKFKKNGWINGAIISILYISILYILSSLANNSFEINKSSIFMIIFGLMLGIIGGIIGVNLKK